MSYPRLAQRLYNAPLCITAAKLEVIESVFRAYSEGRGPEMTVQADRTERTLATVGANRTKAAGYAITRDGIAVVPIVGTLVHRAGGMDAMSGLTSYQQIGTMLAMALDDFDVQGMVLDIDSPGGEASGVAELAQQIRATNLQKPVVAVANEGAFSAAYWLASAAQYLFGTETGMVGSVGVRMLHVDQSKMDEKRGLVYTPIFAGDRKEDFSSHAPLSNEAHTFAQALVNRLHDQFVQAVVSSRATSARPTTAEKVRGTQAGLLSMHEATELGMADGIGGIAEGIEQVRAIQRAKQVA